MDAETQLVTVPVAAYAAGLHPRALREYLDRDAIPLLVPQRGIGAWRRLTPADVLRFAILGQLVWHGLTVKEAASVITGHIDPRISDIAALAGLISWPLLRGRLARETLIISREPSGLAVSLNPWLGRRSAIHRAPAFLTIDVCALAATAAERVRDYPGTTATTGRPVCQAEAMENAAL